MPNCGVTVIWAVSGAPGLLAVKLMFPVPEAGKPIPVLSFNHENVAPPEPLNGICNAVPPQTAVSPGLLIAGADNMEIVNV